MTVKCNFPLTLIYLFDDEHPLPKHTRAIPDVLGTKKSILWKT